MHLAGAVSTAGHSGRRELNDCGRARLMEETRALAENTIRRTVNSVELSRILL